LGRTLLGRLSYRRITSAARRSRLLPAALRAGAPDDRGSPDGDHMRIGGWVRAVACRRGDGDARVVERRAGAAYAGGEVGRHRRDGVLRRLVDRDLKIVQVGGFRLYHKKGAVGTSRGN